MKKRILISLFCFTLLVSNAYAATLQKGASVFARSNLCANSCILTWHNLTLSPDVIPAGAEVKIIICKGQEIVFTKVDSNKRYKLVANSAQWDKYFTKDKNDVNLEKYSSEKKELVTKSQVAVGMTKEEVYLAKGCPAYIGHGIKSYNHPLSDIMQSNTWYYMKDSRRHEKMVKFEKDVVVSIGDY